MKKEVRILGIMVNDPANAAASLQHVFSRYGCSIRTRLGLHDVEDDYAGNTGLILLELTGDITECQKLENELLELDGIDVQKMIFSK